MATLTCASCGVENDGDETFCLECGSVLTASDGPVPPVPDDHPAERRAPDLEECPHCGAEVPDPGNLACVDCLRPFAASEPPPPRERSRDADPRVAGTRRDAVRGARLRLTFAAGGADLGVVEVDAAEELLVGREPASRCAALFDAWDNVSRRHAVVGLESDGAAWVRDEYSTNGTSVNDVPVRPGRRSVLQHGDRLAFGADVVAVVAREEAR